MSAVEAGLDVSSLPENFTSHWDMSSAAFFCGTIITTIGRWGLTSKLPFEDPATKNFSEVMAFSLCCKDWILDKWKNKLFTEQFASKFKSNKIVDPSFATKLRRVQTSNCLECKTYFFLYTSVHKIVENLKNFTFTSNRKHELKCANASPESHSLVLKYVYKPDAYVKMT